MISAPGNNLTMQKKKGAEFSNIIKRKALRLDPTSRLNWEKKKTIHDTGF
jgi:hypothetical protein